MNSVNTAQQLPSPSATGQTADQNQQAPSSLSRLAGDYTSFLKLLTAQVSNQDPLEPMDSSTFVTQLAQLSQVEQSVRTNTNLEGISTQIAGASAMAELHLLGRNATINGSRFSFSEEDTVTLGYQLAEPADEVSAKILAEDGTVVRTLEGLPTSADTRHFFEWDGLDDTGLPVVADSLSFELDARAGEEDLVSHSGYVSAAIQSIILDGSTQNYVLDNGETVSSDRIVAVN